LSLVAAAIRKELLFTLAFTAGYLALAFAAFEINPESLISPAYLPIGLVVAGTLLYGRRVIFSVFLATLLFVPMLGYDLITAVTLSLHELLCAVLVIYAADRILGRELAVNQPGRSITFIMVMVFLVLPVSAFFGALQLGAWTRDTEIFTRYFAAWWQGDVVATIFFGTFLTLALRRLHKGGYSLLQGFDMLRDMLPHVLLTGLTCCWIAGFIDLPRYGLLFLFIPAYIAMIMVRNLALYSLSVTVLFLFTEHMIYLGHDVFGAQDGSFWVFAVTMGVFGPGWFLISVLNRNQQLIDSEMSEKSAAIEKAESTRNSMFEALNQLSLARDNETGNHILRTQHYVRAIARQLRDSFPSEYGYLDDAYIEALFLASPLHDIGKVGIPDSILLKPGKLSEAEWTIMQTHALIGENVLSSAAGQSGNEDLLIASQVAGGHHEKWDGSGYPRRLKGQDVPVAARIMAIADVYDALTTERVYKSAWQHTEAIAEIQSLEGKQFDPAIVAAFLAAEEAILEIGQRFGDEEVNPSGP
jgi:hypothetical protein